MERHCAPSLQLNPPVRLCCLSHRGQLTAVGRGGSRHKDTRVSLSAMVIRAAGREQPAGTALAPGSSRFPSPLRCVKPLGGEHSPAASKGEERRGGPSCSMRDPPRSPRPPQGHHGRGWREAGPGGLGRPGGPGGWVASQVPRSEERGSLQMSSGPRRRARRVSATYGGWI